MDPAKVVSEAAGAADKPDEPRPAVRAVSPDRVELWRGVEPGLVGLDDPDQPIAVEVSVLREPVIVADDPGDTRRVADRDVPGPGQRRRLDARRHRISGGDDVVG